jgi:organic radical activating enzyme
MLYVVEHFYSFQGEGLYSGKPSIFIRFGGCNLGCKGFNCSAISPKTQEELIGCDSIFAVNQEHFELEWLKIYTLEDLVNIVNGYIKDLDFIPDIVITGGEPLINWNDSIFYRFICYLVDKKFQVTIETNASIKINFYSYLKYKDVTFSMSVKLSNSLEDKSKRVNYTALQAFTRHSNCYFKFAIDKEYIQKYSNSEIKDITKDTLSTPIFCMPLGDSVEELSKNDKDVIEFCKRYGYSYSDRMHIRVYNKRHGV